MKTRTKVSFIIFIMLATLFCVVVSFWTFKHYVETGESVRLILASIDMLCAMINILNLGINLERWKKYEI